MISVPCELPLLSSPLLSSPLLSSPLLSSPLLSSRKRPSWVATALGLFLLLALAGCDAPATPEKPATPKVTISAVGDVTEGKPLEFLVRADPAPSADLTVGVDIASPGCELTRAPESVKIAAGKKEATLSVPTEGAGVGTDGCTVTAKIKAGKGYQVGAAAAASANANVAQPAMQEPPDPATPMQPEVTIKPTAATVSEGSPVSFTLTASPAPATALTVNLEWTQVGSFLPESPPPTAIIPTSGTETVTVTLPDDNADEPNGSVTVTAEPGSGYAVGTPASATVDVTDDDPAPTGGGDGAPPARPVPAGPVVTISPSASRAVEGSTNLLRFVLTAEPAPASPLTVDLEWSQVGSFLPANPPETAVIPTTGTEVVTITLPDDTDVEPDGSVTLTVEAVEAGSGYAVGNPSAATIDVFNDDQILVSVAAVSATITEGEEAEFTITAAPAPASDLTVNVGWRYGDSRIPTGLPTTVTIPTTGTKTVSVQTTDDDMDNTYNGDSSTFVSLTIDAGTGYAADGSSQRATVTVEDND